MKRRPLQRHRPYTIESLEQRHLLAGNPFLDPFVWEMAPRTVSEVGGRITVPNTPQWVNPGEFEVRLDISNFTDLHGVDAAAVDITVTDPNLGTVIRSGNDITATGGINRFSVAVPEGMWNVNLSATTTDGTDVSDSLKITVDDILVIALGDSYASGEGNPEVIRGNGSDAVWMSAGAGVDVQEQNRQHRISHRSSFAAAAQMAAVLEESDAHTSVTFVFLASSGAKISEGILGAHGGIASETGFDAGNPMPPQLQEVANLVGDREIEIMTLSVGGNDVGFVNAIAGLLLVDPQDPDLSGPRHGVALALLRDALEQGEDPANPMRWQAFVEHLFPDIQQTLQTFEAFIPDSLKPIDDFHRLFTEFVMDTATVGINGLLDAYRALDLEIDALANPPNQVFITEYPDPLTEMSGGSVVLSNEIIDDLDNNLLQLLMGGSLFNPIDLEGDADEIAWARQHLLTPLNDQIAAAATELGWTLVDSFAEQFAGRGYSAGAERMFVTATESSILQGPDSTLETTGTLHPNRLGHEAIARSLATSILPTLSDAVFPATNAQNRFDVNNSNTVSPVDALAILNHLNRGEDTNPLNLVFSNPRFYDVSRDNLISALDALQIINFLSRLAGLIPGATGEAGSGDTRDDNLETLDPLSQFYANYQ